MVQVRQDEEDKASSTSAAPLHLRAARLYQAHVKKHTADNFHDRRAGK